MNLSDISIQRPVLAVVMSTLLVLFGVIGLSRLSVREYPDIDPPIVSVTTVYPGANAQVVETTLTEVLEEELVGIEGIKTLQSNSQEEVSNINIEFELSRAIEASAQDVRDRVARVRGRLPTDVEDPIVEKQDSDADALMWIAFSGKGVSPLELTDYADRYIVDYFQTISGVGRVIIGGAREYAMRLWLDPVKMSARKVTALDVRTALQNKNVEIPAGRVEGVDREFTVRALGELKTPQQFNRLIIKQVNGRPVYFEDIGSAEIGPRTERSMTRFNGEQAIGLGIVKQSKANILDVAREVKTQMALVKKQLPSHLSLDIAFDSSQFVEDSVQEVKNTLFISGFLVVLVIFAFLGSFRSTVIPAVAIPVSIITTFAAMYLMGFTINILTLLSLTLAIGLVVDDAIVVLENIFRHLEMGKSPFKAALEGTREILFPVIATTVSLVAVFVPLGFMEGVTGRLFIEFSVALAFSVVISTFVSLSLSPMLCSKWLKPKQDDLEVVQKQNPGAITRFINTFKQVFESLRNTYTESLNWTMAHKLPVFVTISIMLLFSAASYLFITKELLPTEDRDAIFTFISGPEGATLEYTDRAVKQAEAIYSQIPEVKQYFSALALSSVGGVGQVNSGIMFVSLKPKNERSRKQQQVVQSVLPKMLSIPESFVFPIDPPSRVGSGGFGKPIQFVIQGFDLEELAEYAGKIAQKAQAVPGLYNVESDLKLNKPQLQVSIDREAANYLGVNVRDIADTLQIVLGGKDLSNFQLNNKRYDVMVQAFGDQRMTPEQLSQIFVRGEGNNNDDENNGSNPLVPITNVIDTQETVTPKQISHYGRLRSATISGGYYTIPGVVSLETIMKNLEKIAAEELPQSIRTTWAGETREFLDAQNATLAAFLLALFVVYLVLSAQFESFIHPIIIMLTVPLAVCGALVTLFISGASLNIYSQIGMILLIGLVTKNGILIVEYANRQLEENPEATIRQAIVQAANIRFRPILMTSIATIFGALPIAFGLGAGSESRQPLGLVVVGGMILSTFLTLYVVPMVYELMNRRLRAQ